MNDDDKKAYTEDEGMFPGSGRRSLADAKLSRLQRENEQLREENEILKKAAKYFARESE